MTEKSEVTYLELRGGDERRQATITITTIPPFMYADVPKIQDLPPDMREALRRWLEGAPE